MFKIVKATLKDAQILSVIGKTAFLTAHGHSAPQTDIDNYVDNNLTENNFLKELEDTNNIYYLIFSDDTIAGYSKIVLNTENENIDAKNITLLSRIYLLKEFYGLNLGKELFNFNVKVSKENNQKGIWLAVWVENKRAIKFYEKAGFVKVGKFDFKISETHYNPNHIMYLDF
ncbi:Acetyltransferase (GNAT) family protein [Polaribacter sp. KT25b]|uniref:GNAT family N-acetyltransferase n=1 Tax=Polaribacter sp. KT25b TaxID=1855336 RepID=UPI00087DA44B|nr:GNAT family N-acetyltransferase [Polaribacter sp. KT25b]SDR77163.1 Acetyltransferase (GNAT) family protein [Polaribacter sp. KT25b]